MSSAGSGSNAGGGGSDSKAGRRPSTEAECQQCHFPSLSPKSGRAMNNNNNTVGYNNNNNNGGGMPPIQVTAKVLFGHVSAISALNAERKKKS